MLLFQESAQLYLASLVAVQHWKIWRKCCGGSGIAFSWDSWVARHGLAAAPHLQFGTVVAGLAS